MATGPRSTSAYDLSSKVDPEIHVLGDAARNRVHMPKSGLLRQQPGQGLRQRGRRGALTDGRAFPAKFANTCWSLIETDDGVKVGATYEASDEGIVSTSSFVSQVGRDTDETRAETYRESLGWYAAITEDMFA
jgi:sulfide dehydrogenase [flavocytochrome c] flavoprotein subunit